MEVSPRVFRARDSLFAEAMHARSLDTDMCPDDATAVRVGDHTRRIPVRTPDMATIALAHDPDRPAPPLCPCPGSIPHARRTTVNLFLKSVRRVDDPASSESPHFLFQLSISLDRRWRSCVAVEKLGSSAKFVGRKPTIGSLPRSWAGNQQRFR